jgi:glycosyltransferase involved in cell wall biosynthesis
VTRVAVISPEPTPYRAPIFDRLAQSTELDLTVAYTADTVAGRDWQVELRHPHLVLGGVSLPTARLLHHDYPVTPGVIPFLRRGRFDVVVAAGWSLFASQAAVVWARTRGVPYLVTSESHGLEPRPAWTEAAKRVVLPRILGHAAGLLVTGTLAARYAVEHGARPASVHVFPNTIDVDAFAAASAALARRRGELRERLGIAADEVAVLEVARLVPQKAIDATIRAVAAAQRRTARRLRLVVAGGGPLEAQLRAEADRLGVPATFAGSLHGDEVLEGYAAADVFCLLSLREPWGVVVNEALAFGLPAVLSDRVGAAYDLLQDGRNGYVVAAGDDGAAAAALARLADDDDLRARFGAASRAAVADWGYARAVREFEAAVGAALRSPR